MTEPEAPATARMHSFMVIPICKDCGHGPDDRYHIEAAAHPDARYREALVKVLDALVWTSGSDDFGPDGKARDGWVKVAQPAIDAARQALRDAAEPGATG